MGEDPGLRPGRQARGRDATLRSTRRARSTPAPPTPGDGGVDPQDLKPLVDPPPQERSDPLDELRNRLKAEAPHPPPGPGFPATPSIEHRPRLEAVRRSDEAADERRRQLWRDSATILIGVVLALLVGQAMFPAPVVGPAGSPTPLPSGVVNTVGPPASLPPGATFGPIIDPSLPIDATPTPIPVITMGPSPSPSPSPTPSPAPTASRRPSPSPKPSPKPPTPPPATPTIPPATPTPTPPPPPPSVTVACDPPASLSMTVSCTASPSNFQGGSQVWLMGGAGTVDVGGNGTSSITFTYTEIGQHTVQITVTGLDGSTTASDSTTVTVPGV